VPVSDSGCEQLDRFLAEQALDGRAADRLVNLTLQLNELDSRWQAHGARARQVDFFRD
jgi:hypothetical protein